MQEDISVEALSQAIDRLDEAIAIYDEFREHSRLMETARDSLVKRFEFTYELAAALTAKHLLEDGYERERANRYTKPRLWRTAGVAHLVEDVEPWLLFNQTRNITAHEYVKAFVECPNYDERVKAFRREVQALLTTLSKAPADD